MVSIISPPFAAGCSGLFRQGITGKQRFSRLFWMCQPHKLPADVAGEGAVLQMVNETLRDLFFNDYRRVVIDEIE